jgi:signal transduction histidine kinase
VISLRAQVIGAVVLTLLGVVALAAYGRQALVKASDAARVAEGHLAQIHAVATLEEKLHELDQLEGAPVPGDLRAEIDERIEELLSLRWADPMDAELVRRVSEGIRRPAGEVPDWAEVKGVVSRLETRAVDRSRFAVRVETRGKAHDRARRIVGIGLFILGGLGALLALLLARFRSFRRAQLEKLRESDRLAALGGVAASVAHELNNPLATIGGCAAAVRERLESRPDADPQAVEYLSMISEETERCSALVENLRDLSRDGSLAISTARLGELARKVVALVGMDPRSGGVEYAVEAESEVEILCDPDKIKQLLLNLVVNARDASGEGGRVVVRVDRPEPDRARIVVEDHGAGIPAAELCRIFEPFHTGKARGLGLGLFLCRRIVTLHRGTIHAESDGPGRGARFVVDLPEG